MLHSIRGNNLFDKEMEKFLPVRFDRSLKLKEIQDFCWNDGSLYLATSHGLFESRPIRKKKERRFRLLYIESRTFDKRKDY